MTDLLIAGLAVFFGISAIIIAAMTIHAAIRANDFQQRKKERDMRPGPYRPARRSIPWWWTWGGLWMDGQRYAVWPQAREYLARAKKKQERKDT